ncbi:fluoride export protein 2 isoform X2 [Amborella trichopoda]|uniref:fluoride export protein 2 isoform X2 n=1 Tax=Amborella trichopoda TaxID=13333 RepID=UPI0009BD0D5E|nr:fluoride export protein 2 isoform X2 [Amborella trichopoda]|eukprot:XP_020530011.1 fluoride export protein 2 isoform X2 [Amborella trichopoda]
MDGQENINGQAPGTDRSTIESYLSLSEYRKGSFEFKAMPIPNDALMYSDAFCLQEGVISNMSSPLSPLASEIMSPLSIDAMLDTRPKEQASSEQLEVLLRYGLQVVFGPDVAGFTDDHSPLFYSDFPANILGSFLMGWFGFVFKPTILEFSEELALGLTTGFLGSLTTFSSWIQKMLTLTTQGRWVFGLLGLPIGLWITIGAIRSGIETGKKLRQFMDHEGHYETSCFDGKCRVKSCRDKMVSFGIVLVMLALVLGLSIFLTCQRSKKLGLACLFGPLGVWTRWFLTRFNGRGFGSNQRLMWIPWGTLLANVLASGIMASLSTLNIAEKTEHYQTVIEAIQLGFLGCMSTVSTFVAEVYSLAENGHVWRAFWYSILSIGLSFALGTLVYSVPVWTKCYSFTDGR